MPILYTAKTLSLVCAAAVCATFVWPGDQFAFAEKGGNGNGNRNENSDRGNNGRGQEARELRGANAAHANENALIHASANSMPGKLNAYRESYVAGASWQAESERLYSAYQTLLNMTPEQIAAAFPSGGYEEALSAAASAYNDAAYNADAYAQVTAANLNEITGGRTLSSSALAELHALLGL